MVQYVGSMPIIARPATRRWHQQIHTDEFDRSTEMTRDDIVKHISGPVPAQSKFLDLNYILLLLPPPPSSSSVVLVLVLVVVVVVVVPKTTQHQSQEQVPRRPECPFRNPTRNPLLSCYPARNLIQSNPILTAAAAAAGGC